PSFNGTAPAGYTVRLLEQADGAAAPTQVGQTTAQADGTWQVAANSLGNGNYTFSVSAFDPAAPDGTTRAASIGRVAIDNQGPTISNITFDARHGLLTVIYQDNVGLNRASLLDPTEYTLAKGAKRLAATSVVDLGPAGPNQEKIQVKIGK